MEQLVQGYVRCTILDKLWGCRYAEVCVEGATNCSKVRNVEALN